MLTVGQVLPLAIEKPAVGGRMLARADGRVVLVGGAIPGEQVRARVTAIGKGVVYADTLEVTDASPDRCPPRGDPACGGSTYSHITYAAQLPLKSAVIADALSRIGRIMLPGPVTVVSSPVDGYRMRARLHLRGHSLGFFREETHMLCSARATGQLLPATCDALDAVARAFGTSDMVAEVEIAENLGGTERVVCVESSGSVVAPRLAPDGVPGLTGLLIRPDPASGGPTRLLAGAPWVTDLVDVANAHLAIRRHVQSFFQGNRYLLAPLIEHVIGLVPDRARMMDLYAGVGLFGLAAALARRATVVAIEGDRHAAADLESNARSLHDVEAHHESVESFLARRPRTPDVLVVDPPRAGVSRVAMAHLIDLRAPTLVYVSCDVATFARDARRLLDGGYAIGRVSAFDLFPNTPHVETVATFEREIGG